MDGKTAAHGARNGLRAGAAPMTTRRRPWSVTALGVGICGHRGGLLLRRYVPDLLAVLLAGTDNRVCAFLRHIAWEAGQTRECTRG